MKVNVKSYSEAVEGTVAILKSRFNNLSVEETIKLAHQIVQANLEAFVKHSDE